MKQCLTCRKSRKLKNGLCKKCRPQNNDKNNEKGIANHQGGRPELVENGITTEKLDRLYDSILGGI